MLKITDKNKAGFTLLELLVVVVIIGILAAIALPQYKMAVLKSRFATVKQNTKILWEANQRYYMVNGSYATNIDDLDVQVNSNENVTYRVYSDPVADGEYFLSDREIHYWITGRRGTTVLCAFSSDNTSVFNMLDKFCKQDTDNGKKECDSSTSCYYYYNIK